MVLPKGLEFLHFGWWVIHVLAILFVYTLAYRRGRNDEKREQRLREKKEAKRSSTPAQ